MKTHDGEEKSNERTPVDSPSAVAVDSVGSVEIRYLEAMTTKRDQNDGRESECEETSTKAHVQHSTLKERWRKRHRQFVRSREELQQIEKAISL